MNLRNWIGMAALLALSGCTLPRPDRTGATGTLVPASYAESGGPVALQGPWWKRFETPELDGLMEEAFAGNPTLAQYVARLRQQQALAAKANAGRNPSATGTASAGVARPDLSDDRRIEAFALGLSASYELDLWGRVRASAQSAALGRDASRYDLESATMALSANIANTWFGIIAQQARLELLHRQLEANTRAIDLLKLRQRNALSTSLEVLQQKQVVDSTRALIPAAELQRIIVEIADKTYRGA